MMLKIGPNKRIEREAVVSKLEITDKNLYHQKYSGYDSEYVSLRDLLVRDGTKTHHKTSKRSCNKMIKDHLKGENLSAQF